MNNLRSSGGGVDGAPAESTPPRCRRGTASGHGALSRWLSGCSALWWTVRCRRGLWCRCSRRWHAWCWQAGRGVPRGWCDWYSQVSNKDKIEHSILTKTGEYIFLIFGYILDTIEEGALKEKQRRFWRLTLRYAELRISPNIKKIYSRYSLLTLQNLVIVMLQNRKTTRMKIRKNGDDLTIFRTCCCQKAFLILSVKRDDRVSKAWRAGQKA